MLYLALGFPDLAYASSEMNVFWGAAGALYPSSNATLFDGPAYARVRVGGAATAADEASALIEVVSVDDGAVLYNRTLLP